MQIASAELKIASKAASRIIEVDIDFKWDAISYTAEEGNLLSVTVDHQISSPRFGRASSGAGIAAVCNITLANPSGRYSPESGVLSDIATNKAMGVQVRVNLGVNTTVALGSGKEVLTQFIGRVDNPVLASPTSPTATFSCIGEAYLAFEEKGTGDNTEAIAPVTQNKFAGNNGSGWLDILAAAANMTSTDINDGMFRIPWLWFSDGDDVWREMQLIAAAEVGFCYLSMTGEFRFENAWHWITDSDHSTSVETLDESDYKDISLNYEQREVYNSVEVPYKPRTPGNRTKLFTLTETWQIEPSTTIIFTAKLRQPAIDIEALVANDNFVIVDDGGVDRSGDATIITTVFAQKVEISVQNTNATYQITFRKLELFGQPLVGGLTGMITVDKASSSIGDPTAAANELVKRLTVPANDYIQTREQAEFIANILADRLDDPRMTVVLQGVPGRCYFEPGDRITIACSQESINDDFFITGISQSYDSSGEYSQSLTCLEAAGFFEYTAAQYFLVSTSGIDGSDKMFY